VSRDDDQAGRPVRPLCAAVLGPARAPAAGRSTWAVAQASKPPPCRWCSSSGTVRRSDLPTAGDGAPRWSPPPWRTVCQVAVASAARAVAVDGVAGVSVSLIPHSFLCGPGGGFFRGASSCNRAIRVRITPTTAAIPPTPCHCFFDRIPFRRRPHLRAGGSPVCGPDHVHAPPQRQTLALPAHACGTRLSETTCRRYRGNYAGRATMTFSLTRTWTPSLEHTAEVVAGSGTGLDVRRLPQQQPHSGRSSWPGLSATEVVQRVPAAWVRAATSAAVAGGSGGSP
jgi:hypothetical protein